MPHQQTKPVRVGMYFLSGVYYVSTICFDDSDKAQNWDRDYLGDPDSKRVLLLAPPLSTAVPPQFTGVPPFSQIQYGFVR
jgi:hypothetical protein